MAQDHLLPLFLALVALVTSTHSRAVNISNTWMLPEEGFPVFYRYFRDRISWYEADAVCQFHHANLVTADSGEQFDAIRAYLKELDIADDVWIGLSKTSDKPNFTWTDFKSLSGEGHWKESIPKGSNPLCAAMDPAGDFLWKALPCGGPDVAAFICELPIPSWASGPKGCLLTELPSLTVLYIPEQSALELTSDCGLDGTKRIACKGDADRDEILKQLSCAITREDFEDKSTLRSTTVENTSEDNSINSRITGTWTSNTIDVDYGMPTRHRRETENTLSPGITKSTTDMSIHEMEGEVDSTTGLGFDTVTTSPENDSTLDSSVSRKHSDKSTEIRATVAADFTTRDANTPSEEQQESTVYPKDEEGEYPSAINQGQLFSIIGNGTMFDIIEFNETAVREEVKLKEAISSTPPTTNRPTTIKTAFTTVEYPKEPPSGPVLVTNKSLKKQLKPKKISLKDLDPKKANYPSPKTVKKNKPEPPEPELQTEDPLTREVEMLPIFHDSSVILNRTHRKELPERETEDAINFLPKPLGLADPKHKNVTEILKEKSNKRIELTIQQRNDADVTIVMTSKKFGPKTAEEMQNMKPGQIGPCKKKPKEVKKEEEEIPVISFEPVNTENKEFVELDTNAPVLDKQNPPKPLELDSLKDLGEEGTSTITTTIAPTTSTTVVGSTIPNLKVIDPKLDVLNSNLTSGQINNASEQVPKPESDKGIPMKSSSSTEKTVTVAEPELTEALEETPEELPKPKRQRQLTRPQRRSFYPYFFSRVLG